MGTPRSLNPVGKQPSMARRKRVLFDTAICPCGNEIVRYPSQNKGTKHPRCSRECANKFRTRSRSLEERFWEKVKKTEHCWLWIGATTVFGYGHICVDGLRLKGLTHRISWEWSHGPIPSGMSVLHHCDVPACVNPAHLFLGTQGDNLRDCIQKGRGRWRDDLKDSVPYLGDSM